jgi:hypothetical protein
MTAATVDHPIAFLQKTAIFAPAGSTRFGSHPTTLEHSSLSGAVGKQRFPAALTELSRNFF